jgi:hypothetical protein
VTVAQPSHRRRRAWRRAALVAALVGYGSLPGCAAATPSPSEAPVTPGVSLTPSAASTTTPEPTATPEPRLALPTPAGRDQLAIGYTVTPEVKAGASGRLLVVIINLSGQMVPELVLRWPTALRNTIFLAPFEPSTQRIREGGDPLVQPWTKWVEGPGESGEPAGTTSLGWGPLLAGGTLTIPVLATRVAPGPITFDLQILSGESVLVSDGTPAWLQVTVP